jgi:hypothetical protein
MRALESLAENGLKICKLSPKMMNIHKKCANAWKRVHSLVTKGQQLAGPVHQSLGYIGNCSPRAIVLGYSALEDALGVAKRQHALF